MGTQLKSMTPKEIVAELFSGSGAPGPQSIGEKCQVGFKVFPAKGLFAY